MPGLLRLLPKASVFISFQLGTVTVCGATIFGGTKPAYKLLGALLWVYPGATVTASATKIGFPLLSKMGFPEAFLCTGKMGRPLMVKPWLAWMKASSLGLVGMPSKSALPLMVMVPSVLMIGLGMFKDAGGCSVCGVGWFSWVLVKVISSLPKGLLRQSLFSMTRSFKEVVEPMIPSTEKMRSL